MLSLHQTIRYKLESWLSSIIMYIGDAVSLGMQSNENLCLLQVVTELFS